MKPETKFIPRESAPQSEVGRSPEDARNVAASIYEATNKFAQEGEGGDVNPETVALWEERLNARGEAANDNVEAAQAA